MAGFSWKLTLLSTNKLMTFLSPLLNPFAGPHFLFVYIVL
ncbi:unnamed protein product, partial [Brassica oleracea]